MFIDKHGYSHNASIDNVNYSINMRIYNDDLILEYSGSKYSPFNYDNLKKYHTDLYDFLNSELFEKYNFKINENRNEEINDYLTLKDFSEKSIKKLCKKLDKLINI